MEILLFSTENTQFKSLIVDQIELIYNVLFNLIPCTMCIEGLCSSMNVILIKLMSFHFENQTTKFDKLGSLFSIVTYIWIRPCSKYLPQTAKIAKRISRPSSNGSYTKPMKITSINSNSYNYACRYFNCSY